MLFGMLWRWRDKVDRWGGEVEAIPGRWRCSGMDGGMEGKRGGFDQGSGFDLGIILRVVWVMFWAGGGLGDLDWVYLLGGFIYCLG